MDRRNLLAVLALTVAAPSVSLAKEMENAEKEHSSQTLAVGSVALETSKIAEQKAESAWVKKFAQFEVAEQTTISEILKGMGATPAKATDKQLAMIAKAKDGKAGAAFDKSYMADQIE